MLKLILIAAQLTAQPAAVIASPPHIVRIATVPALAVTPEGTRLVLPAGTEIGAERLSYRTDARTTDIHPNDWKPVFRDSFERAE